MSENHPTAPKPRKPLWRELLEIVGGALLVTLISRGALAEPRYIPSESMLPRLAINDRLMVEKIAAYPAEIKRGDVLVFYPPHRPLKDWGVLNTPLRWASLSGDDVLIKRVVGLPGEVIEIAQGKVWINGQEIAEDYIREAPAYEMPALKVPADHVFMLGDNRNNSADSHVWGPLPTENILGHALFKFWPPHRIGPIR
jgi:signal peptidase I